MASASVGSSRQRSSNTGPSKLLLLFWSSLSPVTTKFSVLAWALTSPVVNTLCQPSSCLLRSATTHSEGLIFSPLAPTVTKAFWA